MVSFIKPKEAPPKHDPQNPYSVLGLEPPVSDKQIDKAFKNLVFRFHPDRNPGWDEYFNLINRAREVLLDPELFQLWEEYGVFNADLNHSHIDKRVVQALVDSVRVIIGKYGNSKTLDLIAHVSNILNGMGAQEKEKIIKMEKNTKALEAVIKRFGGEDKALCLQLVTPFKISIENENILIAKSKEDLLVFTKALSKLEKITYEHETIAEEELMRGFATTTFSFR